MLVFDHKEIIQNSLTDRVQCPNGAIGVRLLENCNGKETHSVFE